jgi:hypothetical protein
MILPLRANIQKQSANHIKYCFSGCFMKQTYTFTREGEIFEIETTQESKRTVEGIIRNNGPDHLNLSSQRKKQMQTFPKEAVPIDQSFYKFHCDAIRSMAARNMKASKLELRPYPSGKTLSKSTKGRF